MYFGVFCAMSLHYKIIRAIRIAKQKQHKERGDKHEGKRMQSLPFLKIPLPTAFDNQKICQLTICFIFTAVNREFVYQQYGCNFVDLTFFYISSLFSSFALLPRFFRNRVMT